MSLIPIVASLGEDADNELEGFVGIPCLLLIRRPRDAIVSRAIFTPEWSLAFLIREYMRFHNAILPYRDKFVVATFDQTTTDLSRVIRRLNIRFGTAFELFDHTDANVNQVFNTMEKKQVTHRGAIDNRKIGRPSSERESLKENLANNLDSPKLSQALKCADHLFDTFSSLSTCPAVDKEND